MELQTERLQRDTGAASVQNFVHRHSRARRVRFVTISSKCAARRQQTQAIALTILAPRSWNAQVRAIDKKIKKHRLMGQTFKNAGFTVRQNRLFRLRLPLLNRRLARLYACSPWKAAEVECYEFWANDVLYGTVVEIKNPSRGAAPARPFEGSSSVRATCRRLPCALAVGLARIWGAVLGLCLYFCCLCHARSLLGSSHASRL